MALFAFTFDTSGYNKQFGLNIFCVALDEAQEVVTGPLFKWGHTREFFNPTMLMTKIVRLPKPEILSAAEKKKQRLLDTIYEKQTERMEKQKQKNYYCSLSDFSHCYKLLTREDCEKKMLCYAVHFTLVLVFSVVKWPLLIWQCLSLT